MLVGRVGVFLGYIVASMLVVMRRLKVMMSGSPMMRRSVVVMYTGRMLGRNHWIFP
jgi:hypothetical protein